MDSFTPARQFDNLTKGFCFYLPYGNQRGTEYVSFEDLRRTPFLLGTISISLTTWATNNEWPCANVPEFKLTTARQVRPLTHGY